MSCIFCDRLKNRNIVCESQYGFAIHDGFPISPGHTLVLPKLHIPDYFDIPNTSITDIMGLVDMVRAKLKMTLKPDGFNIGINCGRAAGQTVDHAHIHVIPRYTGDLPDPRGGVRWVIPEKAKYW